MMLGGVAVPAEPLAQLGAVMMVRAEDATSGTCGENVTWEYDMSTKTLTISGTGEMEDYEYYNSFPWYPYRDDIEHVNIEKGVTSIGDHAFSLCRSLVSVKISDSVTCIGEIAFGQCSSLTSVTIPSSVTGFGGGAFDDTPWLEEQLTLSPYLVVNHVVIASNPETCAGDLVLPDNVTSIGVGAFGFCTSLTSVTIPDSVTCIGDSAFYNCDSLTSVKIPDSVTNIGDFAFYNCDSLTSVTILDGVTSIGGYAFSGCSSLTSVIIPDSVTNFGAKAFEETLWLKKQFALSPYVVVNHVIIDADPETCVGDIVLPEDVTSIAEWAFQGCGSMTSVTIPDNVMSIGIHAFEGCSLTSITIPNGVKLISNYTFYCCSSLTSVTIPDSVTNIEYYAFYFCDSLTSVTIPDSVASIGQAAFGNCESLTSIIIENPECEIYDRPYTICNKFDDLYGDVEFTGTIYGYENSTAQAYAEKYGYNFDTIDHAPKPVDTLGDVSGDNVINAGDAAVTLSAAAAYGATGSYGDMTAAQIAAADIDGSGMVNASDAAYILQYAAIKGANGKEFDIRELVK